MLSGIVVVVVVVVVVLEQLEVAQYINGEMPGLPRPILTTKPIRGLCQRLKGKSGRFRGNLSGARFLAFACFRGGHMAA